MNIGNATIMTPCDYVNYLYKNKISYKKGDYQKYLEKEKASKSAIKEAQNLTQLCKEN